MDVLSYLLGKESSGGSEVNVQANKNVTITENTTTTINPDTGYDALKKVEVTTNVAGGGGLDWSAIGYSEEPQSITDDYNYAKSIYDNWDSSQTNLEQKFQSDTKLRIMPLVDTSNATSTYQMFRLCSTLASVPLLDLSNVRDGGSMFQSCSSLVSVPLFDTSKFQSFSAIFSACTNLKDVPLFDTSSVRGSSGFQNTFSGCINLTDASLDNILQMCIKATFYSSTKTLVRLGFSSTDYPASRIQALPHYQDFIDAGWTIGY